MRIDDVSPRDGATTIRLGRTDQSTSGKALCVAISFDGRRAYLGGHSGVWRSDDGGETWWHPEWPQPPSGSTAVPGALLCPNVYDLHVLPGQPDVVLAATGRDARVPTQSGIYRSTDGARTWTRVHAFPPGSFPRAEDGWVGRFAAVRDDFSLVFAAGGTAVARSTDGGATWTDSPIPQAVGERVFYVAAGLRQGSGRRVYALGSRLWYSRDGGMTWLADPQSLAIGFPTDGAGAGSLVFNVHPTNPAVVYAMRGDGTIMRGEFPDISSDAPATWTTIPPIPIIPNGPTDSGAEMIVPFVTASGDFLLFACDRRTVHVAFGEPSSTSEWVRAEDGHCHVDPHGMAFTPDFHRTPPGGPDPDVFGRMLLVNDGGVVYTDDGARTWKNGTGLSTLGIVNATVNARPGHPPAICMGMGDNSGYSSPDGGVTWETQDYLGGDNDACFSAPRQPSRLIVFAPRHKGPDDGTGHLYYYKGSNGAPPDASFGTGDRTVVPSPPQFFIGDKRQHGWNAVSNYYNDGYRPLVLTVPGEQPPDELDFITIRITATERFLMRSTKLTTITSRSDWVTSATADGPGVKAFQVGPILPANTIGVAQASGGHAATVYFVADVDAGNLWTWRPGSPSWRQLIPVASGTGPADVTRFFVNPYDPRLLYVLSGTHVFRSDDGGQRWTIDEGLERALTEDGAFPIVIPVDGNPGEALLRDMAFDPDRPKVRFAAGPAGVFQSDDGGTWRALLRTSTIATRVNNICYDFVSCPRAVYVSTMARGLLRLSPIDPDWDYPMRSLQAAEGQVVLLRVHDVATKYGPPHDQLDAEVIVQLDTEPEKAFGFQLRTGADRRVARGMLDLLRDAFNAGRRVRLEFVRTGCRTGRVVRVIDRQ